MEPTSTVASTDSKRLSSWKEIASYFERDIRTVQLWETKEGLPIHRHEHSARSSVYAFPAELDAWFKERSRKPGAGAPETIVSDVQPPTGAVKKPRAWMFPFILIVALAAAASWFAGRSTHFVNPAKVNPPNNGTLVVLPFLNLTGDAGQEYLSDGITDELTTLLASQLPLQVVARTSAFEFKAKTDDVRSIGRQLNVAMVLEGSIEKRRDQLRINAQLVRTGDGYHLWSHLYDSNRGNTSPVENLIVQDIAAVLNLSAPQKKADGSGPDEQARELYLRGEYWRNHRSPSDEWRAIGYFTAAINREPLYAQSYLGLAEAYTLLGTNNQAPPADVFAKAREAAQKALQIDPQLGEAHTVLAHIQFVYDWNYAAAESEFQRAIAANPSFVPALHWYGLMLLYEGRFDEAEKEIRRAQALDPLSPVLASLLSRLYLYAGKGDTAIELSEQAIRGNPQFPMPHYALGYIDLHQGKYEGAIAEFDKYYALSDHDPDGLAYLAMAYAHLGDRTKAMELLKQIEDPKTGYSSPYNHALVYAALEDKEQTYLWLEKAIGERSPALVQLLMDPAFREIRDEPRFRDMLRRTGHSKID